MPAQFTTLALLAAFFLPESHAWISLSQARFGAKLQHIKEQVRGNYSANVPLLQRLGFIWDSPSEPSNSEGLGGGIAWAFDPTLCDKLRPRFHETLLWLDFITCDVLKAAVHRGFASWADNHPSVSFIDVTEECTALGQPNRSCPLIELWVTALNSTKDASALSAAEAEASALSAAEAEAPNPAALTAQSMSSLSSIATVTETQGATFATETGQLTAATATPSARYNQGFLWTSGLAAGTDSAPMIETYSAVISFNVDPEFCWYLDSTFCSFFHTLKQLSTPATILILLRIIVYTVWSAALLCSHAGPRTTGSCQRLVCMLPALALRARRS